MTKKMIDVDELKERIQKEYPIDLVEGDVKDLIDSIYESFTHHIDIMLKLPEITAKYFDENGWCWDMFRAPEEFDVLIEGDCGYGIVHEVSWHDGDACPSTPKAFEHNLKCLADGYHKDGKIVAWRHRPTVPEFNKKELSTPSPVAQEGDGWCDNFSLISPDYMQKNLEVKEIEDGKIVYNVAKGKEILLCKNIENQFLKDGEETSFIAWRPLSPIPTRGDL